MSACPVCCHLVDQPGHERPPLCSSLRALFTALTESSSAGRISISRVAPTLFPVSKHRDGRRHKDIYCLSKRKGRLKMHASAFCHYGAIGGRRLTIQFHIMEMNWVELIHYGCPLVSCSGRPLCHF